MNSSDRESRWTRFFPPHNLACRVSQLPGCARDAIAGMTLAAYAIPVSLAYAALAGLPPQVGIYGYMLGGIGYALLGSSRQLAVGPTSAISLMIAGDGRGAGRRRRGAIRRRSQALRHVRWRCCA